MKNPKLIRQTRFGDQPTLFFQNLKAGRVPRTKADILADPRVDDIYTVPGDYTVIVLADGLHCGERTSTITGDTLRDAARELKRVEVGGLE
jgi:hypothetical protein